MQAKWNWVHYSQVLPSDQLPELPVQVLSTGNSWHTGGQVQSLSCTIQERYEITTTVEHNWHHDSGDTSRTESMSGRETYKRIAHGYQESILSWKQKRFSKKDRLNEGQYDELRRTDFFMSRKRIRHKVDSNCWKFRPREEGFWRSNVKKKTTGAWRRKTKTLSKR